MTPLQAEVDAQLLEQGAFSPLELLFSSGRLAQGDYDAWRRREIEFLDTVLMGSPEKIREELEHAVRYARSLGLEDQPQEFHAQGARPGEAPLRISAQAHWHQLIASRYVPARQTAQLDLFVHNPVVALTTGLVRALAARDLADAQRRLDRLYEQSPNHPDLPAFDQLLAALGEMDGAAPRVQRDLIQQITPCARRLLGSHARELLGSLWRALAERLRGAPFSPQEPTLHRSFALAQAQDWKEVDDSVLAEREWWLQAPLALLLAESALQRRNRIEALGSWCRACWRAPQDIAQAVQRLKHPELTLLWRQFTDEEAEADPAPSAALTDADFPAWLLLHEPGLARQLTQDLASLDTPAEEGYRLVHRWLTARRQKRHDEEIAVRRLLQKSHPPLFRLLKRAVGGQAEPAR